MLVVLLIIALGFAAPFIVRKKKASEMRLILLEAERASLRAQVNYLVEEVVDNQQALKVAKEATQAATRAKSDFLSNMSHEIRTPMNGVIGMTDLLMDTPLSTAQYEAAQTIRNSAEALMTVINDILDFSKLEAGKLAIERIAFNATELLEEVSSIATGAAISKGLELMCDLGAQKDLWVFGDPLRVRQILLNLISNAIKFTLEGEVHASLRLSGGRLQYIIRDTGIGIETEAHERVFDSFAQADPSTTRHFGGTGLGLTVSRNLARLMGGDVQLESTPNIGSIFVFEMPYEEAPSVVSIDDKLQPLAGKRILVVDDNPLNRRILEGTLSTWGAIVTTARTGEDALAIVKKEGAPFDTVLLDMKMPGMSGVETAHEMRRNLKLWPRKAILLTSIGREPTLQELREAGIERCLCKPARRPTLLNAIQAPSNEATAAVALATRLSSDVNKDGLIKALIAEDNPVNQKLICRLLSKLGMEYDCAANGEIAVELLERNPYDVVFMDIQMPVMDGWVATGKIRSNLDTRVQSTPIIAMTAHAMVGDREKCLEAGMNDYVSKPFQFSEIRDALSRSLGLDFDLLLQAA
jgi:signal transduction histidine kinase/CheY-like chemotaxis protein